MGFDNMNPYGDPAVDVVIDRVAAPPYRLPGLNRNGNKVTGKLEELKLKPANFGAYATGGFSLDKVRSELGVENITGLFTNNSFDPYGEPIVPSGYELFLSVPTLAVDTGNLYAVNSDQGEVDYSIATLEVWFNGAELADATVIAGTVEIWTLAFLR